MSRYRHVAAALVALVAIAGITTAAWAIPGGSSGTSAADKTSSFRPNAAHAMAVPDGADARHRSLANAARGRQVVAHAKAAAAKKAQLERFYRGVAKAQLERFYQGVAKAQLERFYEGVHQAELAKQAQAAAAAQQAAAQQASSNSSSSSSSSSSSGSSSAGSGGCGGNLPSCCILQHESGGNPSAMNASGAAGKWQIMPGTWAGYGGYASAAQAPAAVQDAKAAQLWAGGAGASNWAGDGC